MSCRLRLSYEVEVQFLLDTDTCVDLLRGVEPVVARLEMLAPDDCGISAITSFELFAGAAKARDPRRESDKIKRLVAVVKELPFEADAARRAGPLRMQLEKAGNPIGPYDILIAAHALVLEVGLVTTNTHEFRRIPGLRLHSWR